jgi:hypothetical protein
MYKNEVWILTSTDQVDMLPLIWPQRIKKSINTRNSIQHCFWYCILKTGFKLLFSLWYRGVNLISLSSWYMLNLITFQIDQSRSYESYFTFWYDVYVVLKIWNLMNTILCEPPLTPPQQHTHTHLLEMCYLRTVFILVFSVKCNHLRNKESTHNVTLTKVKNIMWLWKCNSLKHQLINCKRNFFFELCSSIMEHVAEPQIFN